MNPPSDHARAGRRARGRAAAGAALALCGFAAADAGAQTPARPDSTRADSARRATSDSTARDSAVALARRRPDPQGTMLAQLGVDRLRLSTVGAAAGATWPRRVEPTTLYSLHADYGEIASGVRVLFGVTYWTSRYTDGAVRGLERAVAALTGADTLRLGRIRTSDLALGTELRWWPRERRARRRGGRGDAAAVRPFVAGGLAVHLLDIEGVPINDTFVEQTLDGVALGVATGAGVDATLFPNVILTMHGRYDLFGGAHFASLRAGASYRFDAGAPGRAR